MTTSKPISTISYNTKNYLKTKLDDLVNKQFIDFYAFIEHQPEDDEKKKHIHLYVIPSSKMNTNSLRTLLEEKVKNNDKPLGCMPFQCSKFGDWCMYNLHDDKYLASKGQWRKYHYYLQDFIVSDADFFQDAYQRIDRSKWVGNEKIISAVRQGVPFSTLVRSGMIPVQLIGQYEKMYNICNLGIVQRNGRETHTPKEKTKPFLIDKDTGEITTFQQQGLVQDYIEDFDDLEEND